MLIPPGYEDDFRREYYSPNIIGGYWERRPQQARLYPRLRANLRPMAFIVCITALAAANAVFVPLYLERQVLAQGGTPAVVYLGRTFEWPPAPGMEAADDSALADTAGSNGTAAAAAAVTADATAQGAEWLAAIKGSPQWKQAVQNTTGLQELMQRLTAFVSGPKTCPNAEVLVRAYRKHADELTKMQVGAYYLEKTGCCSICILPHAGTSAFSHVYISIHQHPTHEINSSSLQSS